MLITNLEKVEKEFIGNDKLYRTERMRKIQKDFKEKGSIKTFRNN